MLAHLPQSLHALDCVDHLVWLDVLQLVNVETFFVDFVDEHEGYSEWFASRRVEPETWQMVWRTVADESVVADGVRDGARGVRDVLDVA